MDESMYTYVSTAHAVPGGGNVGFTLRRPDGGPFVAILSTVDAQRLVDELSVQVRIASQNSN